MKFKRTPAGTSTSQQCPTKHRDTYNNAIDNVSGRAILPAGEKNIPNGERFESAESRRFRLRRGAASRRKARGALVLATLCDGRALSFKGRIPLASGTLRS